MNSYNDNLHSGIVTSLNNQEIELKKLKGQFDASMLSLYYSEGSRITAAEKLNKASEEYESHKNISEQAVIDSDVSTNVLQSATKAKEIVANTVTNTAVAAANVQVAANAILKLASDTGSIYSIVQAANFGGDIYDQSNEAKKLMDDTAYLAESVSQYSMEASGAIAEVATGILADKATATDTGVKNLLGVTTADLDTASATVTAANETLATTNKAEKEAEGTLENINSIYYASESAYHLNNEELNLDLKVVVAKDIVSKDYKYTVSFNPFMSAFKGPNVGTKPYPVETYYVLLVKDAVKKNFSISNAESIINNDPDNKDKKYKKISATGTTEPYSKTITSKELNDVNGNPFELGSTYVVFVFADLSTEYKRIINTFDNYLTASSPSFAITDHLIPATHISVGPPKKKTPTDAPPSTAVTNEQVVTFNVAKNVATKIEYRCIFLPDDKTLTKGLLTVGELRSIENEQKALQAAEDEYTAEIHELEELLTKEKNTKEGLIEQIRALEKQIEDGKTTNDGKVPAKPKKDKDAKTKLLNTTQSKIDEYLKKLEKLMIEIKAKALNHSHMAYEIPGFCFNLMIAEKIPAGSYKEVKEIVSALASLEAPPSGTGKDAKAPSAKVKANGISLSGSLVVTKAMTDNFGNRLQKGYSYIPVILSMSNDVENINKQITNALSDFKNTPSFTYDG
ncbi:hypothetical protein [Dokdonia sp.]|uniref:hypothetical protein n=1 Tax=Dokdonia sp. TaxID=2024995 RepID=UPI003264CDD5